MLIRKIVAEDAPEIAALSEQLGYKMSVAQTLTQINAIANSANDIAYAAVNNYRIIGWIHAFYTLRLESAPFCEIAGLVIDEQHRGAGIGKALINHIILWSVDKDCKKLRVRCNVNRTVTHNFYKHLAFTEIKEQKIFQLEL